MMERSRDKMSSRLRKKGLAWDFSLIILGLLLIVTLGAAGLLLHELLGLYRALA